MTNMTKLPYGVPAAGVAGGFPGHHISTPALIPQLMEAATNCVINYCRVQAGEKVLILTEPDTDPFVASCLHAAANLAGADTAMITVPPFAAGGYQLNQPGDMLMGALDQCDLVIACTYFEIAHLEKTSFSHFFESKKRACTLLMGATPGSMITSGRYPVEIVSKIGELMERKMKKCKKVRWTTADGTDLVFEGLRDLSYSRPLEPGVGGWAIFPAMGINFFPETSDGVFTFDEGTLTGAPRKPIKIYVEGGDITGVESECRAEAEVIRDWANGQYYLNHSVIGLNPKVRTNYAPQFERERAAGAAYLGIDGLGPMVVANHDAPGFSHFDVVMDTPTIYLDDETVVDRRKLLVLDDPELIELAAKYGDPKRVLAQNPFVW